MQDTSMAPLANLGRLNLNVMAFRNVSKFLPISMAEHPRRREAPWYFALISYLTSTWTSRSAKHTQSQARHLHNPRIWNFPLSLSSQQPHLYLSIPLVPEQFEWNRRCCCPFNNYYIQWRNYCIKVFYFIGLRYSHDSTSRGSMAIGHLSPLHQLSVCRKSAQFWDTIFNLFL